MHDAAHTGRGSSLVEHPIAPRTTGSPIHIAWRDAPSHTALSLTAGLRASPRSSARRTPGTTSKCPRRPSARHRKSGSENKPRRPVSRVCVCRDVTDENVALTFGFFEGTLEELRGIQQGSEGGPQSGQLSSHIEDVLLDGSSEVLVEITP
jgi:hypothetical protein